MYLGITHYRAGSDRSSSEWHGLRTYSCESGAFVRRKGGAKNRSPFDAYYDDRAGDQAPVSRGDGILRTTSVLGATIEPCPIVQFAKESIHDEQPLKEGHFKTPDFVREFGNWPPVESRLHRAGASRPIEHLVEKHGRRATHRQPHGIGGELGRHGK